MLQSGLPDDPAAIAMTAAGLVSVLQSKAPSGRFNEVRSTTFTT